MTEDESSIEARNPGRAWGYEVVHFARYMMAGSVGLIPSLTQAT
jgi:hypothetical protein